MGNDLVLSSSANNCRLGNFSHLTQTISIKATKNIAGSEEFPVQLGYNYGKQFHCGHYDNKSNILQAL